jgi:hypothetical protein
MTAEEQEVQGELTFRQELTKLINKHGIDAQYTIPDCIISDFLNGSLNALLKLKEQLLRHGLGQPND